MTLKEIRVDIIVFPQWATTQKSSPGFFPR